MSRSNRREDVLSLQRGLERAWQPRDGSNVTYLHTSRAAVNVNEHIEGDGPTVFAHACKMGLEGSVSKRKDSAYRSGRSPDWLKMKNSNAPAVKREAEEDWGKSRGRCR